MSDDSISTPESPQSLSIYWTPPETQSPAMPSQARALDGHSSVHGGEPAQLLEAGGSPQLIPSSSQSETSGNVRSSSEYELTPGSSPASYEESHGVGIQHMSEEVLLEILGYLDNGDLYIIRQVSRRFRRLANDRVFRMYPEQPSYDIPRWEYWYLGAETQRTVHQLLRKDKYCGGCALTHQDGHFSAAKKWFGTNIMCSGCKVFHPRFLFTPEQRAESSAKRICIGLQGKINVCPHEHVSWEDVEEARSGRHDPPEGKMAPHLTHNYVKRCGQCTDDAPLQPGTLHRASAVIQEWEGKMDVEIEQAFPLFYLRATAGELTLPNFQRFCHASVNRETFSALSCPHIGSVGGNRMMSAFDPQRCSCFRWPLAPDATRLHDPEKQGAFICAHKMCCVCEQKLPAPDGPPAPGLLANEKTGHVSGCGQYCCLTHYCWVRNQETGLVSVTGMKIASGFVAPYSRKWVQSLDPRSYGLTEDEEAKHVTWCPDPTCATMKDWGALARAIDLFLYEETFYQDIIMVDDE